MPRDPYRTITILVHEDVNTVDVRWDGLTDEQCADILEAALFAVENPAGPGVDPVQDTKE